MDVHRIRFIDYDPQPIHCVVFSEEAVRPKLAVSRGDGSLEIWNTSDGEIYYKDVIVPGRNDASIEALVWCNDRLFSAGLTGHISEWDLLKLRPCSSLNSHGGVVWCMDINQEKTVLAAGCDDGQVRLYDITGDGVHPLRGLDRQEGRVLSLAWHPSGDYIAVGGADSTVRKMKVATGRCILRITLDEYESRTTVVWDIKFLSDSTIITGDSLGKIQLWNGKHGTLKQSFNLHLADILTLAVSKDENTIYASGIDHKIVKIQKVRSKGGTWVNAGDMRPNTHDVKAISLSKTGLLASGGVDTILAMFPVDQMEALNWDAVTKYLPFPDSSRHFSVAPDGNILMFQTNTSLKFWQLSASPSKKHLEAAKTPGAKSKTMEIAGVRTADALPVNFLEIKSRAPLHILSSCMSQDGSLVSLSNTNQMWLYKIDRKGPVAEYLRSENLPSYKMAFTTDGKTLVMATIDNGVMAVDVSLESGKCRFESRSLGLKKKHSPVIDFEISPNGKYLAAVNARKRMTLHRLEDGQLVVKLPQLGAQPVVFTFAPKKPELVIFAGAKDREVFTYDIENEQLCTCGDVPLRRRFDGRLKLACPNALISLRPRTNVYAVYDNDCLVPVRLQQSSDRVHLGGKRKHFSRHVPYQMVLDYQLLLFAAPLGDGELIVVERPWTEVVKAFPPALMRDRYGT